MTRKLLEPEDFRYDPFQDTSQEVEISNELHVIESSSPYTVRLDEVPLKETPSSITVRLCAALGEELDASETGVDLASEAQAAWFTNGDIITIDSEQMLVGSVSGATLTVTRGYNSTTPATHTSGAAVYGEPFEEVSAAPTAGQYWPDYTTGANGDEDWNTGTLKFNSSDGGKTVAISYQGMGSLMDGRALGTRCQVFTASGVFVVPPRVYTVYVTLCGGGGGGAGVDGSRTDQVKTSGGGGGAEAKIKREVSVTPGDSIAITIGVGGSGGASGAKSGSAGGVSSFGALLSASGGGGGTTSAPGAAGGDGGSPGGGSETYLVDTFGGYGMSGAGGGCLLSGGVVWAAIGAGKGSNGLVYGGGGAGGRSTSTEDYAGGDGAPGIVIVEW